MIDYRKKLEKHLGRKLNSTEIVHHIDGNAFNNNLDNLQIVNSSQHRKLHNSIKKDYKNIIYKKLSNEKNKELILSFMCLDKLFSPKQLDIIYKKCTDDILSKSEKEYYSRVIKKKLILLSKIEVMNICKKILYQKF